MSRRRALFAVGCAALAALVAAITLWFGVNDETPPQRTSAPASEARAGTELERSRTEAAVAGALRRFMDAYLPYEVGRLGEVVKRELRATSTRRFSAQLVSEPVRLPLAGPRPRRARLVEPVSVRLGRSERSATALALLRRRGVDRPSTFRLRLVAGAWVVSGASG